VPADRTYLDYNAGAPLRAEAREAMLSAMAAVGNASSVHAEGRAARGRIEHARAAVARLAGAKPGQITFTSGGTEANATVLSPSNLRAGQPVVFDRLMVGGTEHPSVIAGGRFAAGQIEAIAVDQDGVVDLGLFRRWLATFADAGETVLVSVMLANNETGAIQPVADVARIAHEAGAFVHTDAVQAAGRIPVDFAGLGVDFMTLSAHKIGGPQGVGAIIVRGGLTVTPLITGGGQERRVRAGTENVAAIAGFGAAATSCLGDLDRAETWSEWSRELVARAVQGSSGLVRLFSAGVDRLPQTVCFGAEDIAAETLVIALDLAGVAVSAGAACSSGKVGPSHVLAAMGVPPEWSRTAIRVSFGWETTEKDIDMFGDAFARAIRQISSGGKLPPGGDESSAGQQPSAGGVRAA
jgi:cysteine desulfurase